MGTVHHNAIVITSWNSELLAQAAGVAKALGLCVLGPSPPQLNCYSTLLICPDGSKEGWPESHLGDRRRDSLREWLYKQRYDDGSSSFEWAEISYGSDARTARIVVTEWTEPHYPAPKKPEADPAENERKGTRPAEFGPMDFRLVLKEGGGFVMAGKFRRAGYDENGQAYSHDEWRELPTLWHAELNLSLSRPQKTPPIVNQYHGYGIKGWFDEGTGPFRHRRRGMIGDSLLWRAKPHDSEDAKEPT